MPVFTDAPITIHTTTLPTRGWTPALKARFLDRLAAHGNARAACRAVRLSHEAAYRLRRRDDEFARGWAAAVLLARENGVQALAERAIEGVEEDVWYRGKCVGTRRRYDARLLLSHLARLDKLADEEHAADDAARFDELLACIAGEQPPGDAAAWDGLLPPCREAHADTAADEAKDAVERAWLQADSGKPRKLTQSERDACEAERQAAAAEARVAAKAETDAWLARARAVVDAHAGWTDTPPLPGLPGNPAPPASPAAANQPVEGVPFPLRTLSDVSTSALARALAGPARAWPGKDLMPRGIRWARAAAEGSPHRSAIDLVRTGA